MQTVLDEQTRQMCRVCGQENAVECGLCDFCANLYVQYENSYQKRQFAAAREFQDHAGIGTTPRGLYERLPRITCQMPEDPIAIWPALVVKAGVIASGLLTAYMIRWLLTTVYRAVQSLVGQ